MMLTSRLLQRMAVGSSTAATIFAAYHIHAMGGFWSKVQQRHDIPNGSIFEGGDLFELEVPLSYVGSSNLGTRNQEEGDGRDDDDTAGELVRAFFSAPFFTMERSVLDIVLHRQWPETIHETSSTFAVGTKHAAWMVTERTSNYISMKWGGSGRFGGTTNMQVVAPSKRDDSQFVTLQFGSTLNSSSQPAHPAIMYLHYKYSQLLLAQTAQQLKVRNEK